MPRTPKVFEEKVKWPREFVETQMQEIWAENYESAEAGKADIYRQVDEELERGTIRLFSEQAVKEKYGNRLAVAALGAVPKELNSDRVRLIHDGSYSVDVNRRIKVRDRMRFPLIDDAAAVLVEVRKSSEELGTEERCSVVYDVKRAHKLVPILESDWGLQAFRLPGERRSDGVYVHTRGTFGVASAAYYWQRLAATMIRVNHRLGGRLLGILHLLFADDGWMVAVLEESMSPVKEIEADPVDTFRIDAKAEGEEIVIGGWESYDGGKTENARWFSVRLNRKNAPWAYLKGEPFRNAALELTAVLVAIMLFGKGARGRCTRASMRLTALTDNLSISYVLRKYLSCKFPLSVILLELTCQLKKIGMELDLHWVPRGQNVPADSLTNGRYGDFSKGKRIEASNKFGMTVDTDVSGWVKVKWDHGAEEKCRVGAEGTYDLLVISLPSFTASGAGGMGKACNGQYLRVGSHNGMPKYRQERGNAIMFFEDDGWKMNCEDDTRQWLYQHLDSGATLPPLGRWAVAIGGPNPSPLLQATAAKAGAMEASAPRAISPKATRRKSPSRPKKKEEFPGPPEPEVIRLGDFVYLRGNGRFLQAEGATVSAPRNRADQECQRFLVCPYLNEHKEADAVLHSPETQKLVSTKTFRGRKVKDGDAICLMACSGCFLGITGQVDGSVTVGVLHGRRWVKADFSKASPSCAMVIKTAGKRREVRDGEPFYLQSMASSQLLVVDEKAHVAVTMQSKQPPGDLMSGPKPHQELSFKKLARSTAPRQVPPRKVVLKWCAVGVRVRHIDEPERGEGVTIAEDLPGFMKVRWDNGEETLCRVGADGKYNLYVLERPVVVACAESIEGVANGRDEQVVADRSDATPVLQLGLLGARALFRTRASDPVQVCFRFPSSIMKTIKEETWMGRKRYEKTAGYLVQVDVGLIRQQKLRPEETLPNKQISCDFRCGVPRRVQLSSKEQLVKLQLHPKFFNIFGLAEVAVCLVVMDYSKMSHQYWTLVSYSMVRRRKMRRFQSESFADPQGVRPEEAPKVAAEPKKPEVKEVEEIDSDIEFVSEMTFTVDMRDELKDEDMGNHQYRRNGTIRMDGLFSERNRRGNSAVNWCPFLFLDIFNDVKSSNSRK
eukprot:s1532_g3.t1